MHGFLKPLLKAFREVVVDDELGALGVIADTQPGIIRNVAGIGRFSPGDDAQQSGFTAAIGPNQPGSVARIDIKSNVREKRGEGE
jgi:hypothetical protein